MHILHLKIQTQYLYFAIKITKDRSVYTDYDNSALRRAPCRNPISEILPRIFMRLLNGALIARPRRLG